MAGQRRLVSDSTAQVKTPRESKGRRNQQIGSGESAGVQAGHRSSGGPVARGRGVNWVELKNSGRPRAAHALVPIGDKLSRPKLTGAPLFGTSEWSPS